MNTWNLLLSYWTNGSIQASSATDRQDTLTQTVKHTHSDSGHEYELFFKIIQSQSTMIYISIESCNFPMLHGSFLSYGMDLYGWHQGMVKFKDPAMLGKFKLHCPR